MYLKGQTKMENNEYSNKAIACTIDNCKHHCCCAEYCSLEKIQVGTHESDPTKIPCTDCKSFEMK